jgi:PKD repeat protein
VAAVDNEEGVIGVAPEADLYGVKVLDRTGSGYVSDVILGIEWSIANGMQVISMSLGGGYLSGEKDACDAAYDAGIVLVAAAGNGGDGDSTTDEYLYPAAYGSVIAVGATNLTNVAPYWSNSGPYLELAAPGVDIYSTWNDGGYNTISGTSMACPHVAGTVALVIASDPTLNNTDVRNRLQTTADDLGPDGWDTVYGYGLVDADEAVLPTEPNTPPVADADGPYKGMEDGAIIFDGSGSDDVDGDPLTYSWDFGDGSTGIGVNLTHAYTAGGNYTVTLVVNDGKVNSEPSTTTADITEVNDPPVADAGSNQTALVNKDVTFDGSESYDIDGSITAYEWEFGDGNNGTDVTPTHVYEASGTYTVNLIVTDTGGLTDTDTTTVTVTEVPADTMHIASIEMSKTTIRLRGWYTYATTTVKIIDADGDPVDGATVSGSWSGLTTDTDSGTTEGDGTLALNSNRVKNAAGTFTFAVDNVVLYGWTYDKSANTETSKGITVP